MKPLLTLTTIAVAAAALVGCQSAPKVRPSQPISADALSQMRAAFMQADAGARVGSVDAVLDSGMFLTVGEINMADFPEGTAVAIVDSNRQVVANGTVVRTFERSVHVQYEKKAGQRLPRVGDVAVKF